MALTSHFLKEEIAINTNPTGPNLVVQSFEMSRESSREVYVLLKGRPEGLFSFLLSGIGLATIVRFEVSKDCISKGTFGLWSRLTQAIPCQNVSSTEYGYSRNFLAAFVAGLFLLIAVGSFFASTIASSPIVIQVIGEEMRQGNREAYKGIAAIAATAALVCLLVFFLSKRLVIQVESGGGRLIGVRFKSGIIEGVPLTITTVEAIVNRINILTRDA